ncbi:hypothetical protein VTN96DRAFT_4973 [Rasamsonia emersonii]
MADDGMLLNFSLPDEGIIKPTTKFKGGTWRDRLSAKKIAQRRSKLPNNNKTDSSNPNRIQVAATRGGGGGGDSESRPHKRQKTDGGEFKPSTTTTAGGATTTAAAAGGGAHRPRQVISSLFSSNPTPRTVTEADKQQHEGEEADATDIKPTNAPLLDGIEDFTALGLSQTLAAHLMTKMELKAPTAIQKSSIPQLLKEQNDAFIQAETGSGKTLAYLLPLVQRIMALKSSDSDGTGKNGMIHRDTGLFAIVLAPTRELCKQISVVLENLLRCAHWIVAGTVIGGEKKKSEKARLRKGLNILVATPGRLADHLDNTQVLDVSNVRWLVLDEGDRLMDLGFEEEIQGIVKKLDAKQRPSKVIGLPDKRMTVLCSATLKMNVQRLGEISLKDAVHIKPDPAGEAQQQQQQQKEEEGEGEEKKDGEGTAFKVPAQLKQSYVVTAAKLRLVTLTALMKRTFMRKGSVMKAIIFVSCADSVEFHFEVFTRPELAGADGNANANTNINTDSDKSDDDEEEEEKGEEDGQEKEKGKKKKEKEKKEKEVKGKEKKKQEKETSKNSSITSSHRTIAPATAFSNPSNPVTIYKLHGSLPQHVRTSTLSAFARSRDAAVLICTDVASRGLDLPNVDFVVEYDPAFSADDHLHRIGRTARLGRDGRALIFLLPGCEEGYVEVLKRGYRDGGKALSRTDANEVLKRGFGGNVDAASKDWEAKATEWQLEVERWALENPQALELARRAYQSHIRAYATHVAAERSMFNIKELHLGHLAKAFALRDRPSKINVPGLRPGKEQTKKDFKAERKTAKATTSAAGKKRKKAASGGRADEDDDDDIPRAINSEDAASKMRAKMKELMGGVSEFNLA